MLKEEVALSRTNVTSVDRVAYPILPGSEAPEVFPVIVKRQDRPSTGVGEEVIAAAGRRDCRRVLRCDRRPPSRTADDAGASTSGTQAGLTHVSPALFYFLVITKWPRLFWAQHDSPISVQNGASLPRLTV